MQLMRYVSRITLHASVFLTTAFTTNAGLLYHHAEESDQERHYAKLAGEQAAKQFANAEAEHYISRTGIGQPRCPYRYGATAMPLQVWGNRDAPTVPLDKILI